MAKTILGAVLGAIILFVWSAISWMIVPWPGEPLQSFTNEDAVIEAVKANAPRPGNYIAPNEPKRAPGTSDEQHTAAQQAAMEKMMHGPAVFVAVRLGPFGMGKPLIIQFFVQLAAALIATFLLLQTCGLSYGKRILFVTALGVLIFLAAHVPEWNWWGFGGAYLLMEFGTLVIGWFLASLVIAFFAKGKAPSAA